MGAASGIGTTALDFALLVAGRPDSDFGTIQRALARRRVIRA